MNLYQNKLVLSARELETDEERRFEKEKNERLDATAKTLQDEFHSLLPTVNGDGMTEFVCPKCFATRTRKDNLKTHMKDCQLNLVSTKGRRNRGLTAARNINRQKVRREEALARRDFRQEEERSTAPSNYYQKKKLADEVFRLRGATKPTVELEYNEFLQPDESLTPFLMAQEKSIYQGEINVYFKDLFSKLGEVDNVCNRRSVLMYILRWLHLVYPHFIGENYDTQDVLPRLNAILRVDEDEDDVNEAEEESDEMFLDSLELYFEKRANKELKDFGILTVLRYLYFCFASCGFDLNKIKSRYFYFLTLYNGQPL